MGYMSGKNGVNNTPSISNNSKNSVNSYNGYASKNSTSKNSVNIETQNFTSKKLQGATLIKHYLELIDKEEKLRIKSMEIIKELSETQNQIEEMHSLILTDPRFEFLRNAIVNDNEKKR